MTPSPRPLRPLPHRLSPRRRRAHRALQLALRAAHRRHLPAPHRGHRQGAQHRRSTPASSSTGSSWLGLNWDEGPFFQGEYGPAHRADAERLLAEGKAYRCFCTREELDAQRAQAEAAGGGFRYDRRCYRLPPTRSRAACAPGRRSRSASCCRTTRSPGTTRCTAGSASRDGPRRLRHPPERRHRHLQPGRRVRRHRDADHPRDARRRPHLEHAEADRALPRARRSRRRSSRTCR